MLSLALPVNIYLCAQPADMRKSFDGLWAMTIEHLGRDPFGGGLFVFINKRRDRMKLLYWDLDTLPDDPAVLKQLVAQLFEELQKANGRLQRQEHYMHLLLKKIYGRTSEKSDPRQGVLFDSDTGEAEAPSTPALPATEDAPVVSPTRKNRDRHGRGRIPAEIKREEVVHDLTDAEKAALGGFDAWLETASPKVLPKSPVRGAIDYTLSNWTALSIYPEDGWLDIDNNEGENSLRGLCVGRRNWLFCGSDRGGRAAAV